MKEITTFAHVSSSEEIYFYGELAESYEKSFKNYKNNASIIEMSASLSFLAEKNFRGYAPENYQKVDMIPMPTEYNL